VGKGGSAFKLPGEEFEFSAHGNEKKGSSNQSKHEWQKSTDPKKNSTRGGSGLRLEQGGGGGPLPIGQEERTQESLGGIMVGREKAGGGGYIAAVLLKRKIGKVSSPNLRRETACVLPVGFHAVREIIIKEVCRNGTSLREETYGT